MPGGDVDRNYERHLVSIECPQPSIQLQHPASRRFSQALAGDGCASSILAGPPPSTNVALSCRSLDPACSLVRRHDGCSEEAAHALAQTLGQPHQGYQGDVDGTGFDLLPVLQIHVSLLRRLLKRPPLRLTKSPNLQPESLCHPLIGQLRLRTFWTFPVATATRWKLQKNLKWRAAIPRSPSKPDNSIPCLSSVEHHGLGHGQRRANRIWPTPSRGCCRLKI